MGAKRVSDRKGQTWSVDIIIGVVVFLLILVILYSLLSSEQPQEIRFRQSADSIFAQIDSKNPDPIIPAAIKEHSIDRDQLTRLYAMSYEQLKAELGMTEDFCIFVVDDAGGILPVTDSDGYTHFSVGNGRDIQIADGIYCGT